MRTFLSIVLYSISVIIGSIGETLVWIADWFSEKAGL